MSEINLSKMKVGDEVTVRAVVSREIGHIPTEVRVKFSHGDLVSVRLDDIATHTPAPREFKPGDMVTVGGQNTRVFEILAIRRQSAALWNDDFGMMTASFDFLRHAD